MGKLPDRVRIKDIAELANVSVGTVDRVIHGRAGVSESSRKKVEEILEKLDYHPNMYASALASNKKYIFACLLPSHLEGEYWTAIENGIRDAVADFSDFNISVSAFYYDPYDYTSFISEGEKLLAMEPDGIVLAPTTPIYTTEFTHRLRKMAVPFVYLDSYVESAPPLAFYGQHSKESGYFAARILMMIAENKKEIVIFRKINEGIVGSNQQENREIGFINYMNRFHPECRLHYMDLHARKPSDDDRMLDEFFLNHPEVTTGITFNSKVYIIGEYLQKRGMKRFGLLGYDLLERNVSCLKEGSVTFLIAQQPELQGFNGVKSLCDHLIFKKEVNAMNYMPIDLIAKETIDFYLKFQR